ncbi:hypothetical protein RU639_010779 [Aspergillus parasiticus]
MENTIPKDLQVPQEGGQIPNRWINNDIKPIEADRRTWNFWAFHDFCVLASSNITAHMLGIINSLLGMFYHIGFPLVNRYIWGLYGSLFVLWNWILLSINAVQAWIGGQCIYVSLRAIWPSLESWNPNYMPQSTGMTTAQFVAYIIFMVISLLVLHIRSHKLQKLFYISSATIVIFEIVILIWALASMGDSGFGSTISEPGAGGSGWKIAFGIMGLNVPANALAGGFDMAATFPRYINLCRGAYITVLVWIACNPWKLINTATTFLAVLSSYSIFLGPMVGSMIASYFAVMRRKIKIEDLFPCHADAKGIYWYTYGVNWRAPVAWLCGMVPSLPGFVAHADPSVAVPVGLTRIYYICFLTGTAISAGVYTALHYIFPTPEVRAFVEEAPSPGILLQEYRLRWDRGSVNEIVEQVKP